MKKLNIYTHRIIIYYLIKIFQKKECCQKIIKQNIINPRKINYYNKFNL